MVLVKNHQAGKTSTSRAKTAAQFFVLQTHLAAMLT